MSWESNSSSEKLLHLLRNGSRRSGLWNSKEIATLNTTSCVFYSLVSVTATIGNGVVLLTIYKDPVRCFRAPRTVLIVALLLCGLSSGLLIDPLNAYSFNAINKRSDSLASWEKQNNLRRGIEVSTTCLSVISLSVLLIYSWQQSKILINREKEENGHREFSTRQAFLSLACVFSYAIIFASLPLLSGLSWPTYRKLHLHLNLTVGSLLLSLSYIWLYLTYLRHTNSIAEVSFDVIDQAAEIRTNRRRRKEERQFAVLTLFLVIVQLAFTLPLVVGMHFALYGSLNSQTDHIKMTIVIRVLEEFSFIKYVATSIVYILGMPQHRQAIKQMTQLN